MSLPAGNEGYKTSHNDVAVPVEVEGKKAIGDHMPCSIGVEHSDLDRNPMLTNVRGFKHAIK